MDPYNNLCYRASTRWRALVKRHWPLCLRRTLEKERALCEVSRIGLISAHEREKAEIEEPILKALRPLIRVRAAYDDDRWRYRVQVQLHEEMVQRASMGDRVVWDYVASRIGDHVRHELKTMNFAGFAQRAEEEDRMASQYPQYRP